MKQTAHKKHIADKFVPLKFALLITSDSRTEKTDKTGSVIVTLLEKAGHNCVWRKIVKNNRRLIRSAIRLALKSEAGLLITSGGTGISGKDVTIESVNRFIVKKLDGFGELFRLLSFREIGASAMMTGALLGVTAEKKVVCALPGSQGAVRLAIKGLLIPELQHLFWELSKR
ncbi:MAG: molybdenum cofactor biosynthesis protein B [Planctomycetota bacterium]|nr:molybdenum cofactor biosynthesis protein B [Planctomycetota bacterium]MDI6787281.1 molybdenum cofactor biosynthesis protein B [Planctomycetota bacterium]